MWTFFDLFAGVGGFRVGLERLGWSCIGWCEIDKWSQKTYQACFDTSHDWFWPDARTLPVDQMPSFDVLTAGWPCQSFSIAGERRGFEDTRGTLVYEVFRILQGRKPRAFLLENVKGLVSKPMRDREFKIILEILNKDLGYQVYWKILNSKDFGVPQNRERVYIVGFREHSFEDFNWPKPMPLQTKLRDVLEKDVPERYYLSDRMLQYLLRHLEKNKLSGKSGFGAKLLTLNDDISVEVPATYYKGPGGAGRPAVVTYNRDSVLFRKLTPSECFRLQGFPEDYIIKAINSGVSDTQLYKQAGNAVTVPVVEAIGRQIQERMGRDLS